MKKLALGWFGLTMVVALGVVIAVAATSLRAERSAATADAKAASTATSTASHRVPAPTPGAARVERGRYLVSSIGCSDCHTPKLFGPNGPEPDPARLLMGHPEDSALPPAPTLAAGPWIATASGDFTAWSGPWGTSFAANLTPDENTGIGIWTEEMFIKTLRTGRHMGQSRHLLPPMPWPAYRNLSDEDLASIYAYLRTIPPKHNRVPQPVPPVEVRADKQEGSEGALTSG